LTHVSVDRSLLVFGTKSGDILALDPDKRGEIIWRVNPEVIPAATDTTSSNGIGTRGPVWGAAADDSYAYVGSSIGGVGAVRLIDGERKWYTPLNSTAAHKVIHSAAVTIIPGVLFVAGADGKVWALSSGDGQPLWTYETARAFDTVNAVAAHGGSVVSAGPTVAGGMLFVGSGYGVVNDSPGNVLLAFGLP